MIEVTMQIHTPLGCTVEESLAKPSDLELVFLSAVTPEGNADKAGLLIGDVVMGVTGVFGGLDSVVGLGIDKV